MSKLFGNVDFSKATDIKHPKLEGPGRYFIELSELRRKEKRPAQPGVPAGTASGYIGEGRIVGKEFGTSEGNVSLTFWDTSDNEFPSIAATKQKEFAGFLLAALGQDFSEAAAKALDDKDLTKAMAAARSRSVVVVADVSEAIPTKKDASKTYFKTTFSPAKEAKE